MPEQPKRGAPGAEQRPPERAGEDSAARLYRDFERLERRDAEAPVIIDAQAKRELTRSDLLQLTDAAAARIAAARARSDVEVTRVVAMQLPNSADLIALVLACWRDGLIPMPIDQPMSPNELRGLCRRIGGATILRGDTVATAAAPEAVGAQSTRSQAPGGGASRASSVELSSARGVVPPDTALLKVTSGSSGQPRAVALSRAALAAGLEQIMSTMGITPRDVNLVTIPLAHSYAFDNVLLPLVVHGVRAVIVSDLTPRSLLATAHASRATVLPTVPFLLDLLARTPGDAPASVPHLRLVISAGAPLPRATRESFAARFGIRPRTFYGATECGGISFDRSGDPELPDGCVGEALDRVTIDLTRAELPDEPDPGEPGQGDELIGRVVVRSRSVATAYVLPVAEPSDTRIEPQRFLTADLGRLDGERRLHLVGRASDVINVGGRKVFPTEVERVIRTLPGVRDVVVLGVARSPTADVLRAIVVADPGIVRADIVAACQRSLEPHKVPRMVELCREIPRTARGKFDRTRLDS